MLQKRTEGNIQGDGKIRPPVLLVATIVLNGIEKTWAQSFNAVIGTT